MKWTPEKLAKETSTVSSLPTIYTRLNEAVNDPQSANRDIANILSDDASLAARLLRIANSAFYGFPSKIDTITRAVTVIGTKQLRDLALATSVIKLFEGVSNDFVDMDSFWRHSVACGVAARILATYRREVNVERFFVSGLLHDIGRLIMCLKIPEIMGDIFSTANENNQLLYKVERDVLGFNHAEAGGALLSHWRLPAQTIYAVSNHHRPMAKNNHQLDSTLVHIADIISNAMQLGSSGEQFVPPLDTKAWEQLGLPESILSPTLTELKRQYMDAIRVILSDED
ncbi:MAG: HDOD domain-containing protein [Gammaproteobacteria bacterium]